MSIGVGQAQSRAMCVRQQSMAGEIDRIMRVMEKSHPGIRIIPCDVDSVSVAPEIISTVSDDASALGVLPMYISNEYGSDTNNLDIYIEAYHNHKGQIPVKILYAVYTSERPRRGFHVVCHPSYNQEFVDTNTKNQFCIFQMKDTVNGSFFEACRGNDHSPFRERFTTATPKIVSSQEIYFGVECLWESNSTQRSGINQRIVDILFKAVYPVFLDYIQEA